MLSGFVSMLILQLTVLACWTACTAAVQSCSRVDWVIPATCLTIKCLNMLTHCLTCRLVTLMYEACWYHDIHIMQVPAAAAAATQRAPPPAVRPLPAFPQPGLQPQGLPRAAKPTFRPAALRLDDQGREIDEFGNLVQTKTESVTTLKVRPALLHPGHAWPGVSHIHLHDCKYIASQQKRSRVVSCLERVGHKQAVQHWFELVHACHIGLALHY